MDKEFASIETERLILRRLVPSDADEIAAYRARPEVARFQGWDEGFSIGRANALIKEMAASHPDTPGAWYQLAITLRATGAVIGDLGFHPDADEARACEIGFTVAPEYQGQGLATEAVGALITYLFEKLSKQRLIARADVDNAASHRVLEAHGFRREGHCIDSAWAAGEWRSEFLYALLARQWSALVADRIDWHDDLHWGDIELLEDRLYEFNVAATGYRDGRGFTGLIHNAHGRVIAGISGFTWGGTAKIVNLWVDQPRRGEGLGSRLVLVAEQVARDRGCANVVLDTHTFQAPELYRRLGYTEVGQFDDFPVGHGQVMFQKRLAEETPGS
ncbi:MAG: GNAT family N-acetyltransferase [Acidimicrobiales bacterium]